MSGAVPLLLLDRICFHDVDREQVIFLPYLPQSSVLNVETAASPKHLYVSGKIHSIMSQKTEISKMIVIYF